MKFKILGIIGFLIFIVGCGNPALTHYNPYDSLGVTRTYYPGLANCSPVSVANIMDAETEHPSINDQSHLILNVKNLTSSFMSNNQNYIQFFRVKYTLDAGGNPQATQDPSPLLISLVTQQNNSSTSITPATLQAYGLSTTFEAIISGTDIPWQEIMVQVALAGTVSTGNFLIPQFDADPLTYKMDHSQFPQLYQNHPFYSQINVQQDYMALMQNYCF